jgi:hypothetical protein
LGYTTKLILLNDFTRETLVIWVDKGFLMGVFNELLKFANTIIIGQILGPLLEISINIPP